MRGLEVLDRNHRPVGPGHGDRPAADLYARRLAWCPPPLAALYETIGRCGRPPRDNARTIALYGILLTIVTGLVVPVGVVYVATRV